MSIGSSERYRLSPAPDGLSLFQDLLNTVGRRGQSDLLNETDTGRAWFEQATRAWALHNPDYLGAVPQFKPADLAEIRTLRDTLRVALLHRDDETWIDQWQLDGGLRFQMDGTGRVGIQPAATKSSRLWMIETISLEMFKSQLVGTFPRFKLCANQWCLMAFYDRSKNSSGVWHDVRTCGNEHNLRQSRARRAAARRDQSMELDDSASA
ncbi:CGNR zinc finger domain-containing protein [Frondihabitans peucedani]|uniref:CGNR zinc finger domain-containing protein n=1 Tax=Frondihabitans peucedani TaxID=598626 RepID=A0ABP8E1B9_9MICO